MQQQPWEATPPSNISSNGWADTLFQNDSEKKSPLHTSIPPHRPKSAPLLTTPPMTTGPPPHSATVLPTRSLSPTSSTALEISSAPNYFAYNHFQNDVSKQMEEVNKATATLRFTTEAAEGAMRTIIPGSVGAAEATGVMCTLRVLGEHAMHTVKTLHTGFKSFVKWVQLMEQAQSLLKADCRSVQEQQAALQEDLKALRASQEATKASQVALQASWNALHAAEAEVKARENEVTARENQVATNDQNLTHIIAGTATLIKNVRRAQSEVLRARELTTPGASASPPIPSPTMTDMLHLNALVVAPPSASFRVISEPDGPFP